MLLLLLACTADPKPAPSDADWQPTPGTSWQIQFSGELDTSLDLDTYDLDLADTPDAVFADLRDRGVALICYFSAGSYEDWREDAGDFPDTTLGAPLDGWEGEWWLDIRDPTVLAIMEARLDRAVDRGCDAVDPDNLDGYQNDNGLGLTAADQLAYNRAIADAAHSRGLAVGLKNDLGQIADLVDWFDFAVNEECVDYDECDLLSPFTDADKAVFHIEYVDDWSDAAARAAEVCGVGPDLDTLVKTWDLGSEYQSCEGT